MASKSVLFYDGVCGLCHRCVQFVIRHDQERKIFLCPLQSEIAVKMLPSENTQNLDTIVFQYNELLYFKSRAIFKILDVIGGPWRLIAVLRVLPVAWTDGIYDLVARSRYRIFGRMNQCPTPTAEDRGRFL